MKTYVDEWFNYQALWDLQPDKLYGTLKEDIGLWMRCLNDIKKSRTIFDTTETRKEFGPVVIDYGKVQSKVTLKYDSWHKEVLGKFGALLGNEMATFHSQVRSFSWPTTANSTRSTSPRMTEALTNWAPPHRGLLSQLSTV